MLQALLHHKLKGAFANTAFSYTEDTKTSSIIGLMQYLPDSLIWDLLRSSCIDKAKLPEEVGRLLEVRFWDSWSPDGEQNVQRVEPDVFFEFEHYFVIIEAKKTDFGGQYYGQWRKELIAFEQDFAHDIKPCVFIALGGNYSLGIECISTPKRSYNIHKVSWLRLLEAVEKERTKADNAPEVRRTLKDIVLAFELHQVFRMVWLKDIAHIEIEAIERDIMTFDLPLLGGICRIDIEEITLNKVWKTANI